MKIWVKQFFESTKNETELNVESLDSLKSCLDGEGWIHKDVFWSPDLQVDLLEKDNDSLYIIQETYFNVQLSAQPSVVEALLCKLEEYDIKPI